MKNLLYQVILVAAVVLVLIGCENPFRKIDTITGPTPSSPMAPSAPAATPSPLVTVNLGASSLECWPFTGNDFSGTPQDPINLLFAGRSDPRALRAALLFLDGDRTVFGFPNVFPFNCTWTDAIGGVQAGYATPSGWAGSAIQMACGPYDPLRFHLRFFDAGDWTLGGAHFEVLIPGTTEHQVISWELAEQLVVVDFLRSGLLDPALPLMPTGPINPSPFKEIPAVIYNGLPADLKALTGGPLGTVTEPVPIPTDGKATILNLAESVASTPMVAKQEFTINFNQVLPKPFCSSGPFDFILVQGPINLSQRVVLTPSGNFISHFQAEGHLNLTPVNPLTDPPTPVGEPYQAVINEDHKGIMTDQTTLASSFQMQIEIPTTGPFRGQLIIHLQVGPGEANKSSIEVKCLP